ncbi:hypothetical protein AUJ42_02345 [Candidatus Collierbacteria bacterium CG1_02_44_10]|uniref:Uncharacterized protein n=2 Tax=Candidatus Collieribacteriota TaxID=1752725 RepID=A0A2H0VLA9_9BACT|nr:hypothetical protein [bacterium]OIN90990.1 MAG: hypothetical protein AUJ42_02345 [Candidatus Collierbacteria bacterium CG1_02_44_10]PIR99885.1 MAG: hypothetical protein COT86_01510 [Candidatus Collierbacteria bacterium CG10_big_fil_rev_8_21_14_0_10_43_36]
MKKKILMAVAGLVIIAWLVVNFFAAISLEAVIIPGIFTVFWLVAWFGIANTETATIQPNKQ